MLIYNPDYVINFSDYGIGIPSLYSRKSDTANYLLNSPKLSSTSAIWYTERIENKVTLDDYTNVHKTEYINKLFSENNKELLYKAYELINQDGTYNRYNPQKAQKSLKTITNDIQLIVNGTYFTIEKALETNFAYFLGGGIHHAHPDFGHGFCAVNDIAVSIQKILNNKLAKTIHIVDVDAHRGDGTAEIFQNNNNVKTLSIHMKNGWPLDVPEYSENGIYNRSYLPGDIDIGVSIEQNNMYNIFLKKGVNDLTLLGKPDLVFIVGGVDPYELDELPSSSDLKLSKKQLLERDLFLYNHYKNLNIPQAWVAAGGYGKYSYEIHTQFLEIVLIERYKRR